MAERVLTNRDLNRALLARQLLLTRSRLSLARALEQVGGLQAQYAPASYIRLWSSLEGFRLADLTGALERRRVVQGTLMRSTIHLVSARDYWPFAVGVRRARMEWWARTHGMDVDPRMLARAATRVRSLLGDGARRREELVEACGSTQLWHGLPLELVRAPPSGTWERRRADLYAAADAWLGPSTDDEPAGLEHLLRHYLGGFGPARVNDAAAWAGVAVSMLEPVVERLPLRRFRDEQGRELVDLPRALLPGGGVPAPVRFLPVFDATLLVHARRTEILPEEYRPVIFNTKTPQSANTFLVDGAVAGTWRVGRAERKATLSLLPFAPLPRAARAELRDDAARLVRFVEPDAPGHAVSFTRSS